MLETELIKPEDIAEGEIAAIVEAAEEESADETDFAGMAANMASVLSSLGDVDPQMFDKTEQARLSQSKKQALKLMRYAIEKLNDEYFPKTEKK